MAKQIKLAAHARTGAGRSEVKKLRAAGFIPAVMYGAKQVSTNLQVGAREIADALRHAAGEQMLVELEIHQNGKASSTLALIQEVQHHAVRQTILHVDFHAVSADEKIHAHVTVEIHGESIGVKNFGGRLDVLLHSIEVECLPKDLPEIISVDVSPLKVGEAIHLRDLHLPTGVSYTNDGELTVLRIAGATTAEEPSASEGPSQPEVIREKKPVEGAEKK